MSEQLHSLARAITDGESVPPRSDGNLRAYSYGTLIPAGWYMLREENSVYIIHQEQSQREWKDSSVQNLLSKIVTEKLLLQQKKRGLSHIDTLSANGFRCRIW